MSYARQRIALGTLWFVMFGIMFLRLLSYDLANAPFGDQTKEVWSWLLPNIVPTLTLIASTFALESKGEGFVNLEPSLMLFWLAFLISFVYLLTLLILVVVPASFGDDPLTKLQNSGVYLGPFQGLVTIVLGVYFVKKP